MELPSAASLTTVGRKPREMESDAVSPRHLRNKQSLSVVYFRRVECTYGSGHRRDIGYLVEAAKPEPSGSGVLSAPVGE